MSFTSRRSASGSGKPERRDRNGLVGLSGWLFADLLLGVAVIFLVGSEVPQKGVEKSGASLRVAIDSIDESVQKDAKMWKVQDETFRLKISFTEEVRRFEVEDVEISGDADQWVPSLVDATSQEDGTSEFIVELTPKTGLRDGEFTISIPKDAAFATDGSGNIATSQLFNVVKCFRYTGIDADREVQVVLSNAEGKGVDALTSLLNGNERIKQARKNQDRIGFMIIFGGGSQGNEIARENAANVIEALSKAGLVQNSESLACDQSTPGGNLPTLKYKNETLRTTDLDLRLYFLTKTGN